MDLDIECLVAIISLVSAIVGLIAAIVGRKQIIEIRNSGNSEAQQENAGLERKSRPQTGPGLRWYDQTGWLVFALFIFWPVGFYGVYKSRIVPGRWKVLIYLVFFLLVAFCVLMEQ